MTEIELGDEPAKKDPAPPPAPSPPPPPKKQDPKKKDTPKKEEENKKKDTPKKKEENQKKKPEKKKVEKKVEPVHKIVDNSIYVRRKEGEFLYNIAMIQSAGYIFSIAMTSIFAYLRFNG